MSLFEKKSDPVAQELLDEIHKLSKEVAALRGERDAGKDAIKLTDDVGRLKKELVDLRIEKAVEQEDNAREKREVEHMVGLEKKRAAQERDLAIREAQLKVKEEAVDARVTQFEEKMDFVEKSLTAQVQYLKDDIIKEVFKRLPVVEVNKNLNFTNGTSGARKEKAEA